VFVANVENPLYPISSGSLISLERTTTRERRKEEEKDDDKQEIVVSMTEFERWKSSKELHYSQRFLEARRKYKIYYSCFSKTDESGR
jgi:hypothetical protein